MDPDFGKRLTKARLAKGVTVEEASHATRMRPGLIRALEDSNLSQFPNAAYAKSFLILYARYIGAKMDDIAESIDTSTQMRVEDFQYLTSRASEERRLQKEAMDTRYDFVVPQKSGGSWMPLIILVVLAVIGLGVFVVWNNLHRLQTVADNAPAAGAGGAAPGAAPATPPPTARTTEPPRARQGADSARDPAEATRPPGFIGPLVPPGYVFAAPKLPHPKRHEEIPPPEPGMIVLDPLEKTWVVIRTGPGGQLLFEDFLYPAGRPMRLPPGQYFIELRDANAVEITKDGHPISYTSPGVLVN